jgi:ribosomal protein L7/L12
VNAIPVVLTSEAVAALERGQVIEAIKLVRATTGLGLKESKDAVDAYLAANPALREQIAAGASESGRRVALVLALLAVLGLALLLLVQLR